MIDSFGAHVSEPGRIQVSPKLTAWVVGELSRMGYKVESENRPYSPITAIYFDKENGTMWGGASDYGDDYGIAW